MADIFTKEKRSEVISQIRRRDYKARGLVQEGIVCRSRGVDATILKGDERWKQKKD